MRKYYRFYYLDTTDQIGAAQPFELADDDCAIARGRELLGEFPYTPALEIWQGARMVARVLRGRNGTTVERMECLATSG
jgi:hypothetical protein